MRLRARRARGGDLASAERGNGTHRPRCAEGARAARTRYQQGLARATWLPQPMLDPNVPLRIQVTLSPGLRIEGRAWLDNPVLYWEASEIECLCKPWTPSSQALPSAPPTQSRARIEVWSEDLVRVWGGDNSASQPAREAKEALSG